jgi:hypothetical protein
MVASETLDARLARSKTVDGGYSSVPGAAPEPEASALAAIASDDAAARTWLESAQRADGSFGIDAGSVVSDDTAQVCLALPEGPALERALDHVTTVAGANAVGDPGPPPYGWAWTVGAHGWTEPTAWGVLALRKRRPEAEDRIADGLDVLRTQECHAGGWNYGTSESFGVFQPPFAQTTSIALFATNGVDDQLTRRGLDALRSSWRHEATGLLSLAISAAALRFLDDPDADEAASRLDRSIASSDDVDTVALAWAAIAVGPGLEIFRIP